MTIQDVKPNLIQALKELLPKHQYKKYHGFKENVSRIEEDGFKLKSVYTDNPRDKTSPRYWGLWNEKFQKAGEKVWADGHVSKIKALDWPVSRLKDVIKLWVFDQGDYGLTIRNSYDVAVYERKKPGWEGYFHIVVLFYEDKNLGALPSDKELIDENKKLKQENIELKGVIENQKKEIEDLKKDNKNIIETNVEISKKAAIEKEKTEISVKPKPELIKKAWDYHNSNKKKAGYGRNWERVLISFGEIKGSNLQPYTSVEAEAGAKQWSGWQEFAVELKRLGY